jgi:hypothetical protein
MKMKLKKRVEVCTESHIHCFYLSYLKKLKIMNFVTGLTHIMQFYKKFIKKCVGV